VFAISVPGRVQYRQLVKLVLLLPFVWLLLEASKKTTNSTTSGRPSGLRRSVDAQRWALPSA